MDVIGGVCSGDYMRFWHEVKPWAAEQVSAEGSGIEA
jgi:hypothetical protein